jgi:hypothetical protein
MISVLLLLQIFGDQEFRCFLPRVVYSTLLTSVQGTAPPGQTYVSTIEPLNYRRLLERSVNCNWKYIVDKIVCNNDQQASIFLQQKLKIGTADQKHAIVDAIVAQAYQLMINRVGNFLVQRCFEHGTQEQIQGIANAIRGNTVALSMDAFGCHVIQKAFDCVPEEFKATMVSELLRRIPETVIHRCEFTSPWYVFYVNFFFRRLSCLAKAFRTSLDRKPTANYEVR